MDGSSAPAPASTKPAAGGASKFLANLPSRGLFSSTVITSNPGRMRVYICDHDTSPPEDQQVKTNQMNILIRSLTLKKHKGDSSSKDVKAAATNDNSKKRSAERAMDGRTSAKKAMTNTQAASQQKGSKSAVPEKDLQSLTVERLRALLKEKSLSTRGKKDELIERLRGK